jgi:hypothetical protein
VLALDTRARRDGRAFDAASLRVAIGTFTAAARRADDAIAHGAGPGTERELAAAQAVDKLAYGVEGYASVTFPEISKAYASGDAAALEAAVASARAALDRATANLQ